MSRTYNDEMFIDTFEHGYTWLNGFMRNVRRYPKRTALLDPMTEREWDYAALNREANRLAHALRTAGLGKNDVVMTALMNTPEFAFSYIGPRKIGAILNPINFNLSPGEMALLIDHSKPKAFIYSAEFADVVRHALTMCDFRPDTVIMADNLADAEVPAGHVSYEDFTSEMPDSDPDIDFRPHIYDEVIRLCTSGTTALPKNVPINDINEVLSAHDVIMHYPLSSRDLTLNMTPWFHRGGCHSGGLGPVFYVGAGAVVMRNFMPKLSLQWVYKYKITFLMGAPSTLEVLAKAQSTDPVDLHHLKGLVTMGAPLEKAAAIRYLSVLTPNIFNGYGTTESFWNSFLRPFDLPEEAGSIGGSCIDDEIKLVKIYDGKKAEPDEEVPSDGKSEGEVIIWSPAKSSYSYFDANEAEKEKFYKGWIYTGDVGTWDENRYITISGRKDDMIVCAAENVYPSQIEEVLNECPLVDDCMVTAVPDKLRGEAPVAYVIPTNPDVTIDDIADFCKASPMLTQFKRPRWYRLVDHLPHTATGKKQHNVMKEQAKKDLKAKLLKKA